jgi:hypothetical protein
MRTFLAICLATLLTSTAHAAIISGTGGSASAPELAGGTTVGFDSLAPGTFASVTDGAVTISGLGPPITVGADQAGFYNTVGRSVTNGSDRDPDAFRIDFASPVTAFAFNFGASDSSWSLSAFDSNDNVVDTMVILPVLTSNAGDYFGLSGGDISYVILIDMFTSSQIGDQVFIDNVTYVAGDSTIPEPATLAIWSLGALSCAFAAYRRRGEA